MPTFHDPLADAAEASEAIRGLAHASRVFDGPADTYTVFGDLTAAMRSLRQVLDQLAATHLAHRERAHHDDGDHLAGDRSALAAAGVEHLKGWDYGEETTQAALENGYVYDEPPTGALDRVITGEDGATPLARTLGFVAVTAASINAVSGLLITDRMLKMFRRKGD